MRILQRLAALSAVALVATLAMPAGAGSPPSPYQQREDARRKRAEAASQLVPLEASDRQLESAVSALQENVDAQSARVDSARQAAAAAQARVEAVQAQIERTQQRMGRLRRDLQRTAVEAYVHPGGDTLTELMGSRDFTEVSRKQALLEQVTLDQADLLDELRMAEEDLVVLEGEEKAAAAEAFQRRAETERILGELEAARDEKIRAEQALEERISAIRSEAAAHAREEDRLTEIIERAEAERLAAASASLGPGGVSAGGLIWPARGPVTSEFGSRWGRLHAGIDIGAAYGSPIWAAKDGVVIQAGSMGGYGNAVVISHGGGFTTLYGHMSRIAASGGEVEQGEVIGYIGSTGHSTGPHLHFETRVSGSPQNPLRYL